MAPPPRRLNRLASLFSTRPRPATYLAPPLAPRRLERRRLLDGAAPAVALDSLSAANEFVLAGPSHAEMSLAAATAEPMAATNSAPTNIQIQPIAPVEENGVVTLSLTFEDGDATDSHQVRVTWGDGSSEDFALPAGARSFSAVHQYLDDGPATSSANSHVYKVDVQVFDAGGARATANTTVTVHNVAPSNLQIEPMSPVDESGAARLALSFDDPGSLDRHRLEVSWGDGQASVYSLPLGSRSFEAFHVYSDDPAGDAPDEYLVNVRLLDDDGGEVFGAATVTVNNVAPRLLDMVVTRPINENDFAEVLLQFSDRSPDDQLTAEIDWGDGSPLERIAITAASNGYFTAAHRYLDDPSGSSATYSVTARIVDDDGGVSEALTREVTVENVGPTVSRFVLTRSLNENGLAILELAIKDPGTLDPHTIEIDWGDGSPLETVVVPAGSGGVLAISHRYLDDKPSAPPNNFSVQVRISDDDGGMFTGSVATSVNNVAPYQVVVVPRQGAFNEGSEALVDVSFDDPGTLDAHVYSINWGDGTVTWGQVAGRSLNAGHIYADNGTYAVTVTITDDSGGIGVGTASMVVENVAPTLAPPMDRTVDEGAQLSLADIGSFTDPGFTSGTTTENFTFSIDWGDGSPVDAGAAMIDANGSPGSSTVGSFDGEHIYADNGVYIVTVTVADDDGGVDTHTFQVTVDNVAPVITGPHTAPKVNEGQSFTLTELGFAISDPGFNNGALGTTETLTALSVDWGDGSGVQTFTDTLQQDGSPGVPTTADFVHPPHTYADDGVYTVTVLLSDDDGPVVTRTVTIVVENVAPVLSLTTRSYVINEGREIVILDLGSFSDPGFNNPNNPLGASTETFTYTIKWGDGKKDVLQAPASQTDGGPGTPTTGTLANKHFYADNDSDNRYTITVTLTDDDGGVAQQSFEIVVNNVNPTLQPIAATDVNARGQTTLTLSFSDPGTEMLTVMVDWGDRLDKPLAERFVPETVRMGPGMHTVVLTHAYAGPPDPLHPTADIVISVQILDDDFGQATVFQPGASNVETAAVTNPGLGGEPFRIDTTPQVALLSLPERPEPPSAPAPQEVRAADSNQTDIIGASGDARGISEQYLELRVIKPDGTPGESYRLPPTVLNNLPGLFRNLPDGHYAIYLVQSETNVRRLVIEVQVRAGKMFNPGDDAEGGRDRPPTNESNALPAEDQPQAPVERQPGPEPAAPATGEGPVAAGRRLPSSTALYHRVALAGAALAISSAGRKWHTEVERAIAATKSGSKRLQTAPGGPNKPR